MTKLRLVFLAGLLAVASALPASATNFYINAAGAQGNGSGSSAANAADASSASKYQSIVNSHSTSGTVIIYAAGTYLVYPSLDMFSGVTHQGAGIDQTFIKMNSGSAGTGGFTPMFLCQGATAGAISNFKFTGATIDFNTTNTQWWTANARGCSIAFAFSLADHCTIQSVKFINMGSKKDPSTGAGDESFPIFFNISGSSSGNINNNLIDSCIFTQPVSSGNSDGMTCIQMADAYPSITIDTTNVVSNCQFTNLNYPTYSDLAYAQCCSCPIATDNTASGVDSFWFVEPGSSSTNPTLFHGVNVNVSYNTLTNSGPITWILMHPNGTFGGTLTASNNTIGMSAWPYEKQGWRKPTGAGIEQDWTGSTTSQVGAVTIENNTFTQPVGGGTNGNAIAVACNVSGGSNTFDVADLLVENNVYVNFPQDGSEYNITTNHSYLIHYTNSGNGFNKLLLNFAGSNPFTMSSGTGGSMALVSNLPNAGDTGIELEDSSVSGDNTPTDFIDTLTTSSTLVQCINKVLAGSTASTFTFQFQVMRTMNSTGVATCYAEIQASPNDGNPPTAGKGRDRFWTGENTFASLSQYLADDYIEIGPSTFPQGYNSSYPWRGFQFVVTPDGTGKQLTSLALEFTARVNSNATPEQYLLENVTVNQIAASTSW